MCKLYKAHIKCCDLKTYVGPYTDRTVVSETVLLTLTECTIENCVKRGIAFCTLTFCSRCQKQPRNDLLQSRAEQVINKLYDFKASCSLV